MNKYKNTSNTRGAPEIKGKGEERRAESMGQKAEGFEQGTGSRKPGYRLTGRDGPLWASSTGPPTGSKMIRGAPVRLDYQYLKIEILENRNGLARGHPLRKVNVAKDRGQPHAVRGKPYMKPVISTRYEERSETEKLKSDRFLTAFGMTKGCRGTPVARGKPAQGMSTFPCTKGFIRWVYGDGCESPNARGMPGECMNDAMHDCQNGVESRGKNRGQPPDVRGKPIEGMIVFLCSTGFLRGLYKDGSRSPNARVMPGSWKTDIYRGEDGRRETEDGRRNPNIYGGEDVSQMPVARGKPPTARGNPHIELVISTRYEERSVTVKVKNVRFLTEPGMTKGCRGNPPQDGSVFFIRKQNLNRERNALTERDNLIFVAL